MDSMMFNTAMDAVRDWSQEHEKLVLNWADPEGLAAEAPTKDWPLSRMEDAVTIVIAYLAFVVFGSLIMRAGLPALNLRALQFIYNLVQIILCAYMSVEAALLAYRNGYSWVPCNAFNYEKPPLGNLLWLFYISKILDFMDTIFIILGKRWKQLSFLHVYHHATIFSIYWLNLRVGFDGDIYLTIVLNGFIHTVMYLYYFVAMHTKQIWWKKYLTALQMLQFLTMNAQAIYMLYNNCQTFPYRVAATYLVYIQSLFWLFLNFFVQSYMCRGSSQKKPLKKKLV